MDELMELICDCCHWPYICDEEELEGRCEECPIEKELQKLLNPRKTNPTGGDSSRPNEAPVV